MNTSYQNAPLRIKSPQLYQLSYQPNALKSMEISVPGGAPCVGYVPAVCPSLYPGGPYPSSRGGRNKTALAWIGGTVLAAWLLGGPR